MNNNKQQHQEQNQTNNKLSLFKIQFPLGWKTSFKEDNSFFKESYDKLVEIGVFKKESQKQYDYVIGYLSICQNFYPKYNKERLEVAAHLMHYFAILDDYLESDLADVETQFEFIKKQENILMFGKQSLEEWSNSSSSNGSSSSGGGSNSNNKTPESSIELTPADKFTNTLRESMLDISIKISGNENGMKNYYSYISYLIKWLNSAIPLKLSRPQNDFNLYKYIRLTACGVTPSIMVNIIMYDLKVDGSFWDNPIWQKLVLLSCQHVSLVNDCMSYAKEVNNGNGGENALQILSKKFNNSLEVAFNFIADDVNKITIEFELWENKLYQSLINYTPQQLNDAKLMVTSSKEIMYGNFHYSLTAKRYIASNSPFIELRGDSPLNHDKIINKDLF